MSPATYRGRLAPSPTGLLHIGHAATFWTAYQRALKSEGVFAFRDEDLDPHRSKPVFAHAMLEDLHWLGIRWQEGPDLDGPFGPYRQSQRRDFYLAAWRKLRDSGAIYPCSCSRRDLALSASAPNEGDDFVVGCLIHISSPSPTVGPLASTTNTSGRSLTLWDKTLAIL